MGYASRIFTLSLVHSGARNNLPCNRLRHREWLDALAGGNSGCAHRLHVRSRSLPVRLVLPRDFQTTSERIRQLWTIGAVAIRTTFFSHYGAARDFVRVGVDHCPVLGA